MKPALSATLLALTFALGFPPPARAADWSTLDARPTPQWWQEARFGIFIHWGPYSVPAYAKVGEYAEWYWRMLEDPQHTGHAAVRAFHDANYGVDFPYADFAPQFRAELFDAKQWADLFVRSGAKYVVLTSKHHDGFALWPSAHADKAWGRPWNSATSGPQRDLLGELTTAVRATDVKMGIYFSLYEWYNPLYRADVDRYVAEHLVPQFQDVVTRYAPAIIFSDGEWDHPSATWRSTELLTWLFHESPSRAEVVVNDRWGKETRHRHGGYYTTEYGSGLANASHPWEESRGMAFSYGYNRAENLDDYTTSREFVLMLADIVSRGGNFLLDIGPTADGRIPVIMQQRLLDIGAWLRVNGEAIHGTMPWIRPCQWSAGKVREPERGEFRSGYDILQLTVQPQPGFAVKQMLFTRKADVLYAICPTLPEETIVLREIELSPEATVTLLGRAGPLPWRQAGGDVVITLPRLNPAQLPCEYAWTLKITGLR